MKQIILKAAFIFIYATYCIVVFEEDKRAYCVQAPAEAATYCTQKF